MRIVAIVAIVLLTGCATPLKKELVKLQSEGRFFQAATRAMDGIDEDPEVKYPWKVLDLVAADAYTQRLERAREEEARGRLEEARDSYLSLREYLDRLDEYTDLTFDQSALDELQDVEDALAAKWFEAGKAAIARKEFPTAVEKLRGAETLRPGMHPTRPELITAYEAWARDDLARFRYREAITHFDTRFELRPDPEIRAWSKSVSAALGRDAMRRGACRQAVADLRRAQGLEFDDELPDDLAKARACARIEVVALPFEVGVTTKLSEGQELSTLLSNRVTEAIQTRRSEFLILLDRDALHEGMGTTEERPERRFQIRGRITQIALERPDDDVVDRGVKGAVKVSCSGEASWDDSELTLCEDVVPVRYKVHTRRQSLTITATITVIDIVTGEQRHGTTVTSSTTDEVTWADAFVDEEGSPVQVGTEPTKTIVGLPNGVSTQASTAPALPPAAKILLRSLDDLGVQAATAILAAIDSAPPATDPDRVIVRSPIMDPADLVLGGGAEVDRTEPAIAAPRREDLPAPELGDDPRQVGLVEPWRSMGLPLGAGVVTHARTQAMTVQYGAIEAPRIAAYFRTWFEARGWVTKLDIDASDTHTVVLRKGTVDVTITALPLDANTLVLLSLSQAS